MQFVSFHWASGEIRDRFLGTCRCVCVHAGRQWKNTKHWPGRFDYYTHTHRYMQTLLCSNVAVLFAVGDRIKILFVYQFKHYVSLKDFNTNKEAFSSLCIIDFIWILCWKVHSCDWWPKYYGWVSNDISIASQSGEAQEPIIKASFNNSTPSQGSSHMTLLVSSETCCHVFFPPFISCLSPSFIR